MYTQMREKRKIMTKIVTIIEEFITLGQFLKHIDVITTGGQAKWYLQETVVFVDGEIENRRGRKLYDKTRVEIPEEGIFVVKRESEEVVDEIS